jgi:outer membrane protein assembly factor BamA
MIGDTPYSLQGLPIIYTSKSTGFNLGVRMSIADVKEEPFIYKVAAQFWVSDRGVRNHELELDIPKFFSKHWHIRLDYKYLTVIDNNFFGIGNNSVFNKDFITPNNPLFISRTYYQYILTYPSFTFNIEYKLFSEIFSVFSGIGLENATITPHNLDNTSYLYTVKPFGYNGGNTNYVKAGARFDTRDYPFNPTKGVMLIGTYTDHAECIGSDYQYTNADVAFMWFTSFWRYFTLGHRIMVDQIWGNPPFFALAEFRSYQNYQGLGGSDVLRGAPTFRFIDNLKFINQFEIRTRFYNGTVFGQHLQVNVNPFWDLGRVWDRKQMVTFDGFHNSFGSAIRFTWNTNFIAAFTFGVSHDGTSTNLSFGESFN